MPKTPATSSNLKNSKSTEPLCQIDLGQVPPFTTNYLGNAPLPVLAAYGTAPLHRFLLQREEWEHDRILADKERGILRSDRGESMRGLEWRDIVVDEGRRRGYIASGDNIIGVFGREGKDGLNAEVMQIHNVNE